MIGNRFCYGGLLCNTEDSSGHFWLADMEAFGVLTGRSFAVLVFVPESVEVKIRVGQTCRVITRNANTENMSHNHTLCTTNCSRTTRSMT